MAGPSYSTEITGLAEMIAGMKARHSKVIDATKGSLRVEAEQTITAAKRLTPVDEGVLRSSGHAQDPVDIPHGVEIEMGFGGPAGSNPDQEGDVGYAVYVHEDLTARHTTGQAKYLEVPVNQRKLNMTRRLISRIKRRLGATSRL